MAIKTAHTHIGAPEIWSEDLHVLSGPVTICDTDPWLLFLNCSTDTSAQGWRTAQPCCKVTKSFQGDLQNSADLSRSDWPCLAETALIDENVIDQGAGAATPCVVGKRMEMQRAWNELTRFCHFSLHSWMALALQQLRSWIGKIPRVSEEAWDWGWTMIPGSQWHLQNLQARILVSGHECRSACLGIGRFRVTLACLRMRCPRRGSTWGCWHRPFCNLIPQKWQATWRHSSHDRFSPKDIEEGETWREHCQWLSSSTDSHCCLVLVFRRQPGPLQAFHVWDCNRF